MNMKEGQVIRYCNFREQYDGYGVIIRVNPDSIDYVEAYAVDKFTKCYDDAGAIKEKHKDNVRIKHCPPPFKELSQGVSGGVYVVADMDNLLTFTRTDIEINHVRVIDDGIQIDDADMHEIVNHPWSRQLEKEKRYESRIDSIPYFSAGVEKAASVVTEINGRNLPDVSKALAEELEKGDDDFQPT